nr:PH domain-containing protein [Amycolatopsis nigrescens]
MAGVSVGAGVPIAIGIADGKSFGVALAWVLPFAVLLTAGSALAELLRWRATRYRVTGRRFELRFQLVVRSRRSLPRERIRSVDVTANPLQRLFGLAVLDVGTGQHEKTENSRVKLNLLPRAEAERLRIELLERTVSAPAGPGDRDPDAPLARLDWSWIRYAPVSFVAPLIGLAAGGALMRVAEWFGAERGVIDWALDLFRGVPLVVAILILVVVALGVGVIGSLGLFVEMWWNYRLEREPGGTLRVRRGLLTTRSISVEERRLRGVDVVEPIGNRLVGAARVDAVATGMRQQKDSEKTDYHTLLPAVPLAVANQVAADVLSEPVSPTVAVRLSGHPVAARGRRLRWWLVGVLVPVVALAVLGLLLTDVLLTLAWILAVPLLPIGVLLALDAYRNLGHGITGGYLVSRHGTVRRSTVALERAGVIGWTVKQSFFQRRAGLITLTATTAAGIGAYSVYDVGESDGLAFAEEAVPELLAPFLERS